MRIIRVFPRRTPLTPVDDMTFIGYHLERRQGKIVWAAGFMPHAQLYQPADHWIEYSKEWRELSKRWIRPAIMQTMNGKDTGILRVSGT
jgi:hypothetical protein